MISRIDVTGDIFVIGDVHGCADELNALLGKLPLKDPCALVFIGDYIDRGPRSKEVIETLIHLSRRFRVFPLMGNHESSLLEFLADPMSREAARFLFNGGSATLQSYSDTPGNYAIPDEHIAFLGSLELLYMDKDLIYVHAGLPDVPIHDLDEQVHREEFLWTREDFLNSRFRWDKTVIHGHTPCKSVRFEEGRINVDTGCVYNNRLSAVHFPTGHVYEVERAGTTEHVYLKESETSKRKAVRFDGEVDVVLDLDGEPNPFNTKNYNDFGLLIEKKTGADAQILHMGDRIQGSIRPASNRSFHFKGRIVRVERIDGVYRYGVRFQGPPRSDDPRTYL